MQASAPSRHLPIRKDWLAATQEPALEPDRPIIDPHHHLWDRPGNRLVRL
jgi:L-fuconolactonase